MYIALLVTVTADGSELPLRVAISVPDADVPEYTRT
jgi:hypothetical protein